ncbi:MAG: cysteine synthase family protein [Candidatus Undinarchaeales archaeon]|nr:cysteine synthase family protein [Candidatus Undinarchaeales archaeon]
MVTFAAKANVNALIGETPVVKINKLNRNKNVSLYVKLERNNAGGSVKDRIAKYMIADAERTGKLTKDKIILEPTSGNTGIGLAMVAAQKGYKTLFVMPESVSVERRAFLKAFGAELVLTEGSRGTPGAVEDGYKMAKENPDKYFLPDQFNNPSNEQAHYETTGIELVNQVPGKIDVFVAGIGTGGTIMGAGRRIKEKYPDARIVAVEPFLGKPIQGLRNMGEPFPPSIFKEDFVDEKINVTQEDAVKWTKALAKEEGIFAGMSSGAAMHIALQEAEKLESGIVVTVLPDGGAKYLSTPIFKVD